MRYHRISKELFRSNRARLAQAMEDNSMAILQSSDIMPTSGDGVLPFRQGSNFFYLSGIDQEDCMLVLVPDHPDANKQEMLFIKESGEHTVIWEGEKLSKGEAGSISGIDCIYWESQFESVYKSLIPLVKSVYLDFEENPRANLLINQKNERFARQIKEHYPLLRLERLGPLLTGMRMVKSSEEIEVIKQAGKITGEGFERVLQLVEPGVWEFEIEAEFSREFLRNRSRGFAYGPIVASGASACILHYEHNDKQCQNGDLVLMDVAAEYANYNADVTRTIPVNGRFTSRQREIYQTVLKVKHAATDLLRPGKTLKEYNEEVGKVMEAALIELGLLDKEEVARQDPEKPLYKKYYMHGTAHHLGLDVHDVSSVYTPLAPGMVLTVEPGIYIREENLGIRLEDDILIGESENINLTQEIPIEIEEIEDLMKHQQ